MPQENESSIITQALCMVASQSVMARLFISRFIQLYQESDNGGHGGISSDDLHTADILDPVRMFVPHAGHTEIVLNTL